MELALIRRRDTHDATTGELHINGVPFCTTLEDTFHHIKVYGKTRIGAGRYRIHLRKEGGKYPIYLKRYETDGMIWLQNVENFEWVYVHIGNFAKDSLGCILVGMQSVLSIVKGTLTQKLVSSTPVYKELHKRIVNAITFGEEIWITIIDN